MSETANKNQNQEPEKTERELTWEEYDSIKDVLTYVGSVADFETVCLAQDNTVIWLVEKVAESVGTKLVREGKSVEQWVEDYKKRCKA